MSADSAPLGLPAKPKGKVVKTSEIFSRWCDNDEVRTKSGSVTAVRREDGTLDLFSYARKIAQRDSAGIFWIADFTGKDSFSRTTSVHVNTAIATSYDWALQSGAPDTVHVLAPVTAPDSTGFVARFGELPSKEERRTTATKRMRALTDEQPLTAAKKRNICLEYS